RDRVSVKFLQHSRDGKQSTSLEFRVLVTDGGIRWVNFVANPMSEAGELAGQMGLALDITRRVQTEKALRQRTIELEERNEELDAFAHTVAHDLQDPLSLVIGYGAVLVDDRASLSDQEFQRGLSIILQSGRKMSNIIDELFLLTQVRKTEVDTRRVDMAGIVAGALQRLAHLVEEQQAQIVLPDSWPAVWSYEPWIEEVWVNYLSNALKHGGRPPHVELGAEVQSDSSVRFWIRDNGPGLTEEEQARLFTPFTKLSQVRTKGHGLGLSIVRRIVEKLGGWVGVESDGVPGRGSVFYFTLPGTNEEAN
ncbi:MAG: PAS domain-containing sensor histidine kinase, partial [Anaerolineae bacterium]